MMLSRLRLGVGCLALFTLVVLASAVPSFAQQTLGSLNGTVLDPSGAAIADAAVKVTDTAINVTESTTSQRTGFFQIFNLPIGTYEVSVSHDGFETTRLSGVVIREAQASTVDVSLKVGQVSESVEVIANPMLNATDASNGFTMDTQQIAATPLATGSFTQLAVLSPGANAELLSGLNTNSGLGNQNIQANGQRATSNTMQVNGVDVTNIFNGLTSSGLTSQRFNFNIGGGSTSSSSSAGAAPIAGSSLEGASPYGSVGNSLPSPPPETIAELRVNTSMYDAQQGATAGAQVDVNTIAGTNSFHGQVYGDLAENTLNAAPYFFNQQYQLAQQGIGAFPASLINPFLHRWTAGGTMGGPIKKDKIFFFFSFQHLYSSDQSTGLSQLTVPSALTNDRSVAGLDAAAVSYAGGGTYTKAIDPIAMALMSATLPNGSLFIPSAQTAPGTPYQFGVPNVTLIGNSLITSNQGVGDIDYQITSRDRLSGKYYYQDDPVTLPYDFSSVGGFPVTQQNGAQVAAIDNAIAVNPHLNWEQRVGIFRQLSYSSFSQTLTDGSGPANFGINGSTSIPTADGSGPFFKGTLPGMLLKDFPSSQNDSPGVKAGPYSSFADMGFYQNRLNPSTNLIYTRGNHTFFAGGGYSYTQLNIENNRNGIEQLSTSNFESFLQGKVHSSNVLETIDPATGKNNANRYYRTNEIDSYLQDKWQLKSNLSVTLGVRYDYHGGMTEKYGNMFNFDPKLFSVSGTTTAGFTVSNAGFIVAGNNKSNPTAGVSDSTLTGRQWGITPRVGFAWSPKRDHGNFVVRGGGGMYYDRGEYFTYLSQPAGSGYGGPFGVTESAPLATYVTGQGSTLEDPTGAAFSQTGSPAYTLPSSNPTTINTALQNTLNAMTGAPTSGSYAKFGKNCGGVQNQEGYTLCPDALDFGTYARSNTLPYTIDYTLDIQWQPTSDTLVDIGYVGNRGRHAVVPVPLNTPGFATPNNPIWGETASYGFEVLNQNVCGSVYCDYAPIAGEPWNTEDGGNTDFRVPYIGFSPNASYYKTAGNSAYDGLQAHLQKQFSHNYMVGTSYTWSHTLDEQSDLGLFFTGGNPNNLRNSWASSDFDRTNVFSAYFEVRSPQVVKEHTLAAQFINDWFLDGTVIAQSGEPYSLYEFYGAVGSITFGDFPTLMNPILGIKNPANPKAALTGNNGAVRGSGGSYIPAIDPTQIAINYLQPGTDGIPVSTGTDPQDIYETDWAPPQRNIFRQAGQRQINLSLRKQFKITERFGLQYEFNVFNITNTTSLDVPSNQGQIRQNSACSTTAIQEGIANDENCQPGAYYYVNYGQIVTSNNPTDQQTALTNLDQLPYSTGNGGQTQIPLFIPAGVRTCVQGVNTVGSSGCPNNVANFGSVYSTIGSNRMITMGFHFTY
ncbi:MAG: carboxypeptidase regulatory-like domain-containing protein [Terracidiphilus sp.]|jgi:carboxypeptidase family protein